MQEIENILIYCFHNVDWSITSEIHVSSIRMRQRSQTLRCIWSHPVWLLERLP